MRDDTKNERLLKLAEDLHDTAMSTASAHGPLMSPAIRHFGLWHELSDNVRAGWVAVAARLDDAQQARGESGEFEAALAALREFVADPSKRTGAPVAEWTERENRVRRAYAALQADLDDRRSMGFAERCIRERDEYRRCWHRDVAKGRAAVRAAHQRAIDFMRERAIASRLEGQSEAAWAVLNGAATALEAHLRETAPPDVKRMPTVKELDAILSDPRSGAPLGPEDADAPHDALDLPAIPPGGYPIDLNVSTDGHAPDCLLFHDPERGECDCQDVLVMLDQVEQQIEELPVNADRAAAITYSAITDLVNAVRTLRAEMKAGSL